jgi:hypothetical protein
MNIWFFFFNRSSKSDLLAIRTQAGFVAPSLWVVNCTGVLFSKLLWWNLWTIFVIQLVIFIIFNCIYRKSSSFSIFRYRDVSNSLIFLYR